MKILFATTIGLWILHLGLVIGYNMGVSDKCFYLYSLENPQPVIEICK